LLPIISITLPHWDKRDISKLVNDFLRRGTIHDKYKQTIEKNIDLISTAIENNPREIKRFINNYIVAYEIHSDNKEIDPTELLLVQAINVRWNKFYKVMVSYNKEFLLEVKRYMEMQPHERLSKLESDVTEGDWSGEIKTILRDFKSEDELWKFLKAHYDSMSQIKDWEIYRRVTESVKGPTIATPERPVQRHPTYCHNCGQKLLGMEEFCPECGISIGLPPR
jgi:hypothetical protein